MKHILRASAIRSRQAGFTIIELMFATLAFSTILIVITVGILSFTHAYYSGVNRSTVQNTARSIVNTMSQAIEFSGTNIGSAETDGTLWYFCAGGQVFTYSPGASYTGIPPNDPGPPDSNPGLYVTTEGGGCPSSAPDVSSGGGQELLPPNVRVTQLSVQPESIPGATNVYTITLGLALGTNDLLCAPKAVPGSCTSNATLSDNQLDTSDVSCKPQIGSQFCAVSGLSATASVRVAGSALTD